MCNGAVNPHGKFCMHKNVLVPKVKIWNVIFNGLNLPEIKTIFEKVGFFIKYNYLVNVSSKKLCTSSGFIDTLAI